MRLPSKVTVITAAVAGVVGVVIGTAGGSPTVETAREGPTPAAVTTTETKTVNKPPTSCIEALDAAEQFALDFRHFTGMASKMPLLIPRAIQAGVDVDVAAVRAITADMDQFTSRTQEINGDVATHVRAYNASATDCRSAS